jgi:hypothetical protein
MVKQTSPKVAPKAAKTKYPQFRSTIQVPSSSVRGQNHAGVLKTIVSLICTNEAKILEEWLDQHPILRREFEHKGIKEAVDSFLWTLPIEIATTSADRQFPAEFSIAERSALRSLSSKLQELDKIKDEIDKYKSTLNALGSEHLASGKVRIFNLMIEEA